ncbi:NADH:flavin oxidoreductase/NADH oxidase family protein [Corynebacterium pelargi]|uniref:NADH oxidase n=1 Tax=Corynebacterium pelargi TaxID=1471400 RepID=A0A410W868_9CORY|nr:NADH:flavin oxidoreductase/NADH oxidase family protein [Corynebacterium pelargi]QAU52155.1 NADH oxidase [Corynebacterium pelargi]GGG69760.1 2,4-dienoyl-CoA reductase [Corynebacterium pelargi]
MSKQLSSEFTFDSGAMLPNRLVKAAMEESLGTAQHVPGERIFTLYERWAKGGVGTLITGNVMVHDAALTGPQAIVLDKNQPLDPFVQWAQRVHRHGAKIIMQINHPGRQVLTNQPGVAWAPSPIKVEVGSKRAQFAEPTQMSHEQIEEVIEMFRSTALRAAEAGFDGVEVHAAHGYLLSQFLSPLANIRSDQWGGSLENRARILIEILRRIRAEVPKDFLLAVKLNSSDFQRGGFSLKDAARVIEMLNQHGVDFVELSGGSYESPAMTGNAADDRTRAREAYFLSMAEQLVATSPLPLMVTGGIVRPSVAQQVLDSGVALVGIGTALAADPNLPKQWEQGYEAAPAIPHTKISNKALASAASMAWFRWQMGRLSKNKDPQLKLDPRIPFLLNGIATPRHNRTYAKWLESRNA